RRSKSTATGGLCWPTPKATSSVSATPGRASSRSVAERRRALVTDPGPHRDGALHFGAADQGAVVELLGVEADRADVVAAAGSFVALHQLWQRRATFAGQTESDTL